ncbi:LysR family transcriptional regulator [Enterovirga aerilata]|uniref:LysR family transcriptional regulator n=1 Tax=Enterovirga aerilata TaxID=2730920 RepID=A0A849I5U4_9HYPH|nr:LysR substrate-binding domain-containing protein [Enterovirga sp. DB1703]NNM71470.1 LysR family transcriptional regulator [Enterovirga sp. DB1703]
MKRRYLEQKLKVRTLRAIDAIATHGSLLGAAKALNVAQPTLTRSLQELEETFGFRIFDRHARGVRLTPAGEVVWNSTRRILAEIRRLDGDLDRFLSGTAGSVAIGTLPVAAEGAVPRIMADARSRHPDLQIRLVQGRTEELLPLLAAGDIELVVGRLYGPDAPDGFRRETHYQEPISFVARADHPIFRLEAVTVADLARYKLVLPTLSQRLGREIEHILAEIGLSGQARLRSGSTGLTRDLVHHSDSLAILPSTLMSEDFERGTMRIVPFPVPSGQRDAGVIYRGEVPLSPAAEIVLAIIRETIGRIAGPGGAATRGTERFGTAAGEL